MSDDDYSADDSLSNESSPRYDDEDPPARRNTPSPQKGGTSGCLSLLIVIGGLAAGVAMVV